MTRSNETTTRATTRSRRSAAATIGATGVLLALVATMVSGCLFVPVSGGYGYRHDHRGGYHRDGYYRYYSG